MVTSTTPPGPCLAHRPDIRPRPTPDTRSRPSPSSDQSKLNSAVAQSPVPPRVGGTRGRWLGWGLIGGGVTMVPWMWVLATRLPSTTQVSNWSAAWVGLDLMVAAGLLGTGVLFNRRDPRHGLVAAATGALLLADAWFDVMTAMPGADRVTALALAVGGELPAAIFCGVLAARTGAPARAHTREKQRIVHLNWSETSR